MSAVKTTAPTQERLKLLVINASQLVQVTSNNELFVRGRDMDKISIIENGAMVIDFDGKIVAVSDTASIIHKYQNNRFDKILDLKHKQSIVPGLCDCHSHPVWSGDRVHEFAMKLKGATYMDIHKMGGGISFTVRHTRQSSKEELLQMFIQRLNRMLSHGTTLLEAKSGYGLDLKNEMKLLTVIEMGNKRHCLDIVSNYCGAHSVMKLETNADEYTRNIIEEQLPMIAKLKAKNIINPQQIDIFHEQGIFDTKHAKLILNEGKTKYGLSINFHGDELHCNSSAELAVQLDSAAVSHLECISEQGIQVLGASKTVAVLLPTTAHILQIECPPFKRMKDKNCIIALGSDFNPNCFCLSMPSTMNLACVTFRMSLNEALCASTINSAAALKKSHEFGSLEVGKYADFIVINHSNWQHLIYEMVDPPILYVFKKGEQVYEQPMLVKPLVSNQPQSKL